MGKLGKMRKLAKLGKLGKILKRLPVFLIVCLILQGSGGCQQSGPKIAFFVYNGNDTFISEMMEDMVANMPANVNYEVCDAGNSQAVQNQQIVSRIDDGYDLFVINAVDRLAAGSIVEKCNKKGIPIIFFNREPLEDALAGGAAYYVGAASDKLGAKQADMAAELFGNNFAGSRYDRNGDGVVQLVILKGEQGHQDAEKRTDNCVSRLRALGFNVEVLAVEIADWNRQDAYAAMKRLYTQYGRAIELVFSNNDDMALGAIDYLTDAGIFSGEGNKRNQPFAIIGVDGTTVGLDAIGKGLLYGTVVNDGKKQSDAILTLADYILSGKDLSGYPYPISKERYIFIAGDIITHKNLPGALAP